ncbi:MAG: hypothetical protein P8188_11590, partial [Gemmatimonadota bacterium]
MILRDLAPVSRSSGPTAAALFSAVLLAVAFLPSLPAPLLVFVALAPWLAALARMERPAEGARAGAWFFTLFWALHLAWMLPLALRIRHPWPWMAYAGQVASLGLLGAAVGAGIVALRRRRVGLIPAAAVSWVAGEWVRASLLGPLDFPWSGIALPLARLPVLIQPAAWGGEALVALGVVAVNGGVAEALARPGPAVSSPLGIRACLGGSMGRSVALVAAWTALGAGRMEFLQHRIEPRVEALAVQPAVALEVKRGPDAFEAAVLSLRQGLRTASEFLGSRHPGLSVVVFPETHLPAVVGPGGQPAEPPEGRGLRPMDPSILRDMIAWSDAHGVDLLLGAYQRGDEGVMNAVLHLSRDGLEGSYGKVGLIPGVERAPGGLVPGPGALPLE